MLFGPDPHDSVSKASGKIENIFPPFHNKAPHLSCSITYCPTNGVLFICAGKRTFLFCVAAQVGLADGLVGQQLLAGAFQGDAAVSIT